jgi:hypothetical protein
VSEVKFGEVAVQVRLADVKIAAVDAALQDREVAFDGIGVGVAANIFLDAVSDYFMAGKLCAVSL